MSGVPNRMFLWTSLLLDASFLVYVVHVELVTGRKFQRDTMVDWKHPSQSLVLLMVGISVRAFVFLYIMHTKALWATTRGYIVVKIIFQLSIMTLMVFQMYLYHASPTSFRLYKLKAGGALWRPSFYVMMGILFFSTFFQFSFIFELSSHKPNVPDELAFERFLFKGKNEHLNKWRQKWRGLLNLFSKQSEPMFSAVVRLYAHKQGSVESLAQVYKNDRREFEFYIPQLVSFLMLEAFVQSPQLCIVLLERCGMSHIFAHKMRWFLSSFCKSSSAFQGIEQQKRIQMLIEEIADRAGDAAHRFAIEGLAGERYEPEKTEERMNGANQEIEHMPLIVEENTYRTFAMDSIDRLEMGKMSNHDFFSRNVAFIDELTATSSDLKNVSISSRNKELATRLESIQKRYFPSSSLFIPVGESLHHIKQLHVAESFTFSTRERVPYLLCVEVVDEPSREANGHKFPFVHFNKPDFKWKFFGKDENEIEDHPSASAMQEAPCCLGFWSEQRPAESKFLPKKASDVIHGFLDTISKATPKLTKDEEVTCPLPPPAQSADETLIASSSTGSLKNGQKSVSFSPPRPLHVQTSDVETSFQNESETSPHSVQSVPSPDAHGLLLHRVDSTDMYLDSMVDDDEDETYREDSPKRRHLERQVTPPHVVFSERWCEKEERIKKTSPWGHLKGWRLLPVIVKSNDDLRQEQFASQLIRQFSKIFKKTSLPLWLHPYDVIATSPTSGLIEAIPDTISLDALRRHDTAYTTLLEFFMRHFGELHTNSFQRARRNFVESLAAYCIVCYILQIKDRHNGNILLDEQGHIIHIDFGFILSNNPGNVNFESAPFKLTHEFVMLMGGPRSASFRRFRSLCVRAFLAVRKYRYHIILLVEMILISNADLSCFGGDPRACVNRLTERFKPELNTNECENFVHSLIDQSIGSWSTKWYDKYQRWFVGVF